MNIRSMLKNRILFENVNTCGESFTNKKLKDEYPSPGIKFNPLVGHNVVNVENYIHHHNLIQAVPILKHIS
jgi:hypothetical protein